MRTFPEIFFASFAASRENFRVQSLFLHPPPWLRACRAADRVAYSRAVRALLTPIFALLLLCGAASAQQQDRGLEERVQRPNMSMTFDTRQAGGGSRVVEGKAANTSSRSNGGTKEFYFQQKSFSKDFTTKEFNGAKPSWLSRLNFFAKKADPKGKYAIPNADKAPDTATMAVNRSQFSDKSMKTRDLPGVRPYLGKEADKIGTALDPTNLPRVMGEMKEIKTIDDVRELLNKNK